MSKISIEDIDIETLVSFEGFNYRLSNGNSGLQLNLQTCPLCHNDNWKVYFNAETGLGNCFVCGKGINKFGFLKASRGFSHNGEVYNYLSANSDSFVYIPKAKSKKTTSYKKFNQEWVFPKNYKISSVCGIPAYLKNRNIDLKIAERFDIRICVFGFYKYINLKGSPAFVDFSQRIIVPINDIDGNLVTFQGRDMTGSADKKYLFPNMLPSSGAYIYNADYAYKNKFKKIILCEGVFDVFSTTQFIESSIDFKDYCVCGTFGKHLSISSTSEAQDQLRDLYRLRESGLDEIIFLWDGEKKAIGESIAAALRLDSLGFDCKVAMLPNNLDPEEAGGKATIKAIQDAKKVTKLSYATYRLKK